MSDASRPLYKLMCMYLHEIANAIDANANEIIDKHKDPERIYAVEQRSLELKSYATRLHDIAASFREDT